MAFAAAALAYLSTAPAWAAGPELAAADGAITLDSPARTAAVAKLATEGGTLPAGEQVVNMQDWDETAFQIVITRPGRPRPTQTATRRIIAYRPVILFGFVFRIFVLSTSV